MNETQQSVGEWIETTFPGGDPNSPRKAIRALEEMVELCMAAGALTNEIHDAVGRAIAGAASELPQPSKIPIEAADVLIVLYGLAQLRKFDLHAEVDKKMAVNRARKWRALGDGTGYHIKE